MPGDAVPEPESPAGVVGSGSDGAGDNKAGEESEAELNAPRGVEEDFDETKLSGDKAVMMRLANLKSERAALSQRKKAMTKELRRVKKAKERIKKKAM